MKKQHRIKHRATYPSVRMEHHAIKPTPGVIGHLLGQTNTMRES